MNAKTVERVAWQIWDHHRGVYCQFRGRMSEEACRAYVARNPGRFQLIQVSIVETHRPIASWESVP